MLESAGLPPPKGVFCHGYLTVKGQKISKSIPATRVDPNAIVAELGEGFVDPLRYFVLREYTLGRRRRLHLRGAVPALRIGPGQRPRQSAEPHGVDGAPVSWARALGRCHRKTAMPTNDLRRQAQLTADERSEAWDQFQSVGRAASDLEHSFATLQRVHRSTRSRGRWRRIRPKRSSCSRAAPLLRVPALGGAAWSRPAMPVAAREILRQLGRERDRRTAIGPTAGAGRAATLAEPKPLFPRIEPERQAALIAKWMPAADASAAPAAAPPQRPHAAPAAAPAEIAIDDFAKIDLRVAKVVACERVPKSDKLLKLTLDVGAEPRTVVSGIAAAYQPEQMVGRTVIYLANLKPAKIRGVLSQGMILAAGDADVLALSALDRDAPPGTRIRYR